MSETTNVPEYGPPPMDVLISALGALVIGAVIWAGGFATFWGVDYLTSMFGIYPPADQLLNSAIRGAFVGIPILAGLGAAWASFRFLLKLD
ncbi:MAG: hypothetical protein KIT46_07775 [Anaerolineales bacterium]|nr:hypothetical protein [Anaerolineales bacterium]MCW5855928.1 hypothetical protein [Anaerolineales bacterium]